jgi:signal transduction histidine kinase
MLSARGETGTGDQRVAEVAHDLRMPLALILAHCDQLAATLVDHDQLAEIAQIRETASRMGRQVDGLVVREAPARTPVDVTALAGDVVTRFQPLARARSREITFECAASAIVLGSAPDIELALQNVIDNALRNARVSPVRVSVHVGMRHVSIDVADDGPGIPLEQRSALLEAGAQGDAGDGARGKAGLGLGIANTAMRSHGGRVRIGDAPHGGALVTLQLPTPAPRTARRRSRTVQQRPQLLLRA